MEQDKYEMQRWSLAGILEVGQGVEAANEAIRALEAEVGALEAWRERLNDSLRAEDFRALVLQVESFVHRAHALGAYAQLWFVEDTQNQQALALMGRVEQAASEAAQRILFIELWWRALDDATAARLIEATGDAAYYYHKQRLFKPHTLSEPQEQLIVMKDVNGVSALATIYEMMTNKFSFTLEVDGEKQSLTREALMALVRSPQASLREAAYREQFRVYGSEALVLGQIYINIIRDWRAENVGLRKFASPLAVRNLSNHIPDQVVDTLLAVCRDARGVFQRYFKLKAAWLGNPGKALKRFDLYAPVGNAPEQKVPYGDAVAMVREAFGAFSPQVQALAMRVLDEHHIDSELRPGKRGGAFCFSVAPSMTPWVLMNYTGEPRQVATLAHELGHAIHSMLAAHHSILTFHAPLPLAETASIFSEMLLTDYLLAHETDPLVRRDIMAETVDNIYATVLRQAYFVIFEREAHRLATEGTGSVDELREAYMATLREQFGDAVEVDEVFKDEWLGIPHIYHTPFYCYAYSFGLLLSLALYGQYKKEGASFAPRFLQILSSGGADAPAEILSRAGIDMADRAFWQRGFDIVEGMVTELERMG